MGRDAAHFAGQIVRLLGDRALRCPLGRLCACVGFTSRCQFLRAVSSALDQLWQLGKYRAPQSSVVGSYDCEACWVPAQRWHSDPQTSGRSHGFPSAPAGSLRTLPGSVAIAFGLIQAARRNANRAPASSPVAARCPPEARAPAQSPRKCGCFLKRHAALLPRPQSTVAVARASTARSSPGTVCTARSLTACATAAAREAAAAPPMRPPRMPIQQLVASGDIHRPRTNMRSAIPQAASIDNAASAVTRFAFAFIPCLR